MGIRHGDPADRALGMDERITRRDFLDAALLASGSALVAAASPLDALAARQSDWDGYGGVGDYARANGNTYEVLAEGHKVRDRAYERLRTADVDPAGEFDCVIVGGGIRGLAAALLFQRETGGRKTCLVLEDHAIFGGEARRNEFDVDGQRLIASQASAMFFPPLAGTWLAGFYRSIGIDRNTWEYQRWSGDARELPVGRTPYFGGGPTSAFYFGAAFGRTPGLLLVDPWGKNLEGAPIGEHARQELLAMRARRGARAAAQPKQHGDEQARGLDAITLERHLADIYGLSPETTRRFLSPVSGGGSGIGPDVLSAYADYAADVLLPWEYAEGSQMFPGGNAGVARHIVRSLLPDALPSENTLDAVCRARVNHAALDRAGQPSRIRLRATVVAIEHEGRPESADRVAVVYSRGGKLARVRARTVIAAGGCWMTRHIVKDLPAAYREAYAQFHRAPCLMANVAVRNWRFLASLGIHECRWFEGIGNYVAVRKTAAMGPVAPTISPDSPVVLTIKILFSSPGHTLAEQVTRGRTELVGTSYRDYERRLRTQLVEMFGGSGFDPRRDVAGIILNRWGHAYLSPQPGFFFGGAGRPAPGEVMRERPAGRIAFANSDLTGIMDHRTSILEAKRAVAQILPQLT
jgi:spermidine dehydrogenase